MSEYQKPNVHYLPHSVSLPLIGEFRVIDYTRNADITTRLNQEFISLGARSIEAESKLAKDIVEYYLGKTIQKFNNEEILFEEATRILMGVLHGIGHFYQEGKYESKTKFTSILNKEKTPLAKGNKQIAPKRGTLVLNGLYIDIINEFAIKIADKVEEEDLFLLSSIADKLEEQPTTHADKGWSVPKLRNFHAQLGSMYKTNRWLKRLGDSKGIYEILENLDEKELEVVINQMRGFINPKLADQVPTGVFNSPLFLHQGEAMTVYDRSMNLINESEDQDFSTRTMSKEETFAFIEIGQKPRPTASLRRTYHNMHTGIAHYGKIIFGPSTYTMVRVDMRGEIYQGTFSYTKLQDVFSQKGMKKEGLLFELFLLMRLFDLTGRPAIIAKMPSLDLFERSVAAQGILKRGLKKLQLIRRGSHESENNDFIKHLVTPRLKPLPASKDNSMGTIKIDELPPSAIEEKPDSNIVYEMREVPVSATLRRLPQGWNASQNAKDIARDYFGINELPEGWTLVNGHLGERRVRVNKTTNETLVRRFQFKGADYDVIQRLQEMVDAIHRGENPHQTIRRI